MNDPILTHHDKQAIEQIGDLIIKYRIEKQMIPGMILAFQAGMKFQSTKEKDLFSKPTGNGQNQWEF